MIYFRDHPELVGSILLDGEDVSDRCLGFDAARGEADLLILRDGHPYIGDDGEIAHETRTGRLLVSVQKAG